MPVRVGRSIEKGIKRSFEWGERTSVLDVSRKAVPDLFTPTVSP